MKREWLIGSHIRAARRHEYEQACRAMAPKVIVTGRAQSLRWLVALIAFWLAAMALGGCSLPTEPVAEHRIVCVDYWQEGVGLVPGPCN